MQNDTSTRVQVSKSFPVSKDELYRAWTAPDELKQWWKPMGKQLTDVENEIKEGGKVTYHFSEDLVISGEYKKVEEKERLVYSWNWQLPEESLQRGEYLLTVAFNEDGNGSTINITQENFKDEHAVKPHQSGWEEALEQLKHYLSNKRASS